VNLSYARRIVQAIVGTVAQFAELAQ